MYDHWVVEWFPPRSGAPLGHWQAHGPFESEADANSQMASLAHDAIASDESLERMADVQVGKFAVPVNTSTANVFAEARRQGMGASGPQFA